MTIEQKIEVLSRRLGEEDSDLLEDYLLEAKSKILNKLYPYGTNLTDVPERYEQLQLELAITLYNMRGVEGQETHNENGVNRKWRSETAILAELTPFVGLPL